MNMTKCDRCGCILHNSESGHIEMYFPMPKEHKDSFPIFKRFDLCDKCLSDIVEVINGTSTVSTEADK